MLSTLLFGHSMPGEGFFGSFWPILMAACVGVFFGVRYYFKGAQCPLIGNLSGKVVIITGASSGIGLELTKSLTAAGARVIMACRDKSKVEKVITDLKIINPQANVKFIELNLGSFVSVKKFVSEFRGAESRVDILINNGGVMGLTESNTVDGHEVHYQVNYLSHFLLTHLLLDVLQATTGSRVINNTAHAYKLAEFSTKGLINFKESDINGNINHHPQCDGDVSDVKMLPSNCETEITENDKSIKINHSEDFHNENGDLLEEFGPSKNNAVVTSGVAYAQSKLAMILFTKCLASKLGTSTSAYVTNPGVVRTNLYKNMPIKKNPILAFSLAPFLWFFMKSPADGSQTALYCATAKNLKSGEYYCECSVSCLEANTKLGEKELDLFWSSSLKACSL